MCMSLLCPPFSSTSPSYTSFLSLPTHLLQPISSFHPQHLPSLQSSSSLTPPATSPHSPAPNAPSNSSISASPNHIPGRPPLPTPPAPPPPPSPSPQKSLNGTTATTKASLPQKSPLSGNPKVSASGISGKTAAQAAKVSRT